MTDHHEDAAVRPAVLDDVPALVACSAALSAEDAGARDATVDINWPLEHGAERFTSGVDDPSRLLLVAERGGEVVGHLAGAVAEGTAMRPVKVATLVSMYVRPEHRGARTGTRLVEGFLRWAKEQGAQEAEVTAYAANGDAIRFYERNGFTARLVTSGVSL
ncbi:GNAT family N-acetyltransferase [Streptomyces ureilyticus]|uniref:GNAT family N-acetyltransferase n=1 Tax=Streptomyces ureilyticus TaxID=1775131 RepID=A0ABX0DR40_9ACTN|nr:GNAT family N-acetyltransferase [Streptomyces ureilyticus]NGO44368.1 GNAT family N-acetyltransferase [Streptomyces ureilyticus]